MEAVSIKTFVKILRCSGSDKSWYRKYIGETIEVLSDIPSNIDGQLLFATLTVKDVFVGWIRVCDCELIGGGKK